MDETGYALLTWAERQSRSNPMTNPTDNAPEAMIDAAIETILKASGSSIRNYSVHKTLADMRDAMRKIMSDSYIKGSNDMAKILRGKP
jgi:lambda repressor-like predicted transcriptional regulator